MKSIIVTSSRDEASRTIYERLLNNFQFRETGEDFEGSKIFRLNDNSNIRLITTNRELVNAEQLDSLNTDLFVFASKHSSESGTPALLTHFPGNWGTNTLLGGRPKTLGLAAPAALKAALRELEKEMKKQQLFGYTISVEATHHGPTSIKTPIIFVELGSGTNEWEDKKAAEAVAAACIAAAKNENTYPSALAFGSSHYSPRFTELILKTEVALGHIASRHVLDHLDETMIQQAIKKTVETIEFFVVDHKGMNSSQRKKIESFAKELGYSVKRARKIIKRQK
ncbi:MAG: D-aminoacyl-tRNA deacylase [Promethearchaeota archaeon]